MTPVEIALIGLVVLLILLFAGMPIAFAMAVVGFVGFGYMVNFDAALGILKSSPFITVSSYGLSVIPLFILMGSFCFYAGLSEELYRAAHKWLGQLPGGLSMATVGACAGFAAISGSSLATAATMGMVALPEMERYKYDKALATGSVAAGGTIGILIPPSIGLVVYGIITQQSIGKLFLAGFIPGITEALFYIITIYTLCKFNSRLGPPAPKISLLEKITALKNTWMVGALFLVVMGGIYLGVFSPTEAAGIGACGAFVFALARRKLNRKNFKESLADTCKNTAMAFLILVGVTILGYFMSATRLPFVMAETISTIAVNRYLILTVILLFYIFIGCFMSTLAMIILTVPIFLPLIVALGFNPIWFGILLVRTCEIGLITPPFGLNVYILKGIAKDVPMSTMFRGIIPFLIADIVHVAVLVAFPSITLFLPSLMQ